MCTLLLCARYYCVHAITVCTLLLCARYYCVHAITVCTLLLCARYYCVHAITVWALLLCGRYYCVGAITVWALLLCGRYYWSLPCPGFKPSIVAAIIVKHTNILSCIFTILYTMNPLCVQPHPVHNTIHNESFVCAIPPCSQYYKQ